MARDFELSSSEYIEVDSAVLTAPPLSMACWFKSENAAANQFMIALVNSGSNTNYHDLRCNGGGDKVEATSRNGAEGIARTTTTYSTGVWHHAAGVWVSASSRAAYIDGGSKGTNGTVNTTVGIDRISIGRLGRLNPAAYMDGLLAEVAIWNAALSDEEVASLAAGFSPLLVKPENLVVYVPLVRTIQDVVGGLGFTATGTVVAEHPPKIFLPAAPHISTAPPPSAAHRRRVGAQTI